MASHAGFLRPGQPGYAAHLGHTPTPEDSSGSPTGGRHHLEAPIRGAGLRCRPVGLSFGGHLSRNFGSSTPLFLTLFWI
jgi:hypothetical protein